MQAIFVIVGGACQLFFARIFKYFSRFCSLEEVCHGGTKPELSHETFATPKIVKTREKCENCTERSTGQPEPV
jgi:hypothetical protein